MNDSNCSTSQRLNNSTSQQFNKLASHPLTNSSTHLLKTPIIQVKHLSKRYQIGMDRTYKTFCETAVDTIKSPLKRLKSFSRQEEIFWALKDINFEVFPGEVVGIIGRNGAGKSTLLKILSRITHPTEGEVILRGRVASLLEVGTGFHPELTGRENIYFNGAILGMTKQEIEDKFDEIVAFSGVADFLDTPLKRYSSGMQVRLAFAVAAHLEPEILVVDEVLAVGDAEFQKKCLGKMKDVATGGRTVLFVSHNMDAINTLCLRAIVIEGGKVIFDGNVQEGIDVHLNRNIQRPLTVDLSDVQSGFNRTGARNYARIIAVSTLDDKNNLTDTFEMGKKFTASVVLKVKQRVSDPEVGFCISTPRGSRLHHLISKWEKNISFLDTGIYTFYVSIKKIMLYPGSYTLTVWFRNYSHEGSDDFIEAPLVFNVIKSSEVNPYTDFSNVVQSGGVYIKSTWDFEKLKE